MNEPQEHLFGEKLKKGKEKGKRTANFSFNMHSIFHNECNNGVPKWTGGDGTEVKTSGVVMLGLEERN